MGQVLVRKLEDDVIRRLKAKAKASGRSLEDLARSALREAAKPCPEEVWAEIDRIREMNGRSDFNSTAYLRQMRDRGWPRDGEG